MFSKRSAGGTGSACSKNIVGRRPPYFSAPTSGAESLPKIAFEMPVTIAPYYRTGISSRDPDFYLRDKINSEGATATPSH
jgi:hypothetical protein